MAWTTPRTWIAGELVTAALFNTQFRDNENALFAGGIAIGSQAANDVLYASSTVQLARLAAGASGTALISQGSASAPVFGYPNVRSITSKSGTYNPALITDDIINCTANTFTITLYAASGNTGRTLTVKNSGTGIITIDGNASETIDGALTLLLFAQYEWVTLFCDGSNWFVLNSSPVVTPRCVAYRSSTQTFTAPTAAVFALNAEIEDIGAMHDTVTNNDRITVPTGGAGRYRVFGFGCRQQAASGVDGEFYFTLRMNGTPIVNCVTEQNVGGGAAVYMSVQFELNLAVGDYVQLYGDPGGRTFATNGNSSAEQSTTLSATRISRQ